jgi:YbbR domain-containing protein
VRATIAALARRRIDPRSIVGQDIPLKAAAIGVALLLWLAASQALPRDTTLAFEGRVPIERAEPPAGYVARAAAGDVAVRLRGPLVAVERVALEHLKATLDLGGLDVTRTDAQEAPVRVSVADERVTVVEVQPPTWPVRLERLTSRTFAVQARFANAPPSGSAPGTPTIDPAEVTVRGGEGTLATVAAVLVTLRFGDAPVDLTGTAPATAVDAAGVTVEGATVEPASVRVSVPVLPTATTRTLPLLWTLRGSVAAGYWISQVTTDPPALTVRGEPQALAALTKIDVAAVDVSGLTATRAFRAPLVLPSGVALLEPREAAVTVTVVALPGTRPFPLVAITVVGLRPEQSAELDPRTVEVLLAGPVPTLASLGGGAVVAIVDVAGGGAGTYTVDVTAQGPPGTSVQRVQPAQVTLTIRSR